MEKWIDRFAGFLILLFVLVLAIDNHKSRNSYEQILLQQNAEIQKLQDSLQKKNEVFDSIQKVLTQTKVTLEPKFELNSKYGEIYQYMKEKLEAPEANFALAIHETGGFTSNLCQKANNLFGFIYSPKSDFKYWSKGDGHWKSGWNDWKKSVDYMAEWQDKFKKRGLDTSSNEAYIASLRRIGYATDPNHGKKVRSVYNNYFEPVDKEDQLRTLLIAAL